MRLQWLVAIVVLAVISVVSLPTVSPGVWAEAEPSAPDTSAQPARPGHEDTTTGKSDKDAGEKSDEKTSAQEAREEEHKPADPETGTSTMSPETLGLLPNPLKSYGITFSATYIVTGCEFSGEPKLLTFALVVAQSERRVRCPQKHAWHAGAASTTKYA
jgi:hypothetical protein